MEENKRTLSIKIESDIKELDVAIEKAEKLVNLLDKADKLINSLGGTTINNYNN